ncbi:hypothetical protein CKM354_001070700 [Cercospora kikuchii]|uniref:Uncharacterized protein n=1 Tax=Cercospora kikuchii TaxID=84275 RepID=A0A9P3CN64_9PEZI|nr:uncharacterized protein CKM354_001070700 [Cercospora kikuchii]GIZ47619.1 hypothetical protein CKM354_001070700 [Cercospora kikuchii]
MDTHVDGAHFDSVVEFLSNHLDIHPSGAIGPSRNSHIDCFMPVHSSYTRSQRYQRGQAGNTLLRGERRVAEKAIIFDRDIINTWRFSDLSAAKEVFLCEQAFQRAIAQETAFIVIEAFLEKEVEKLSQEHNAYSLLTRFDTFLRDLGTLPITITISSIVTDIIEELGSSTEFRSISPVSVTDFVLSRDCWRYERGRLPSLEVTFEVRGSWYFRSSIKLHCHYAWFPPMVTFHNLQNVVTEYSTFSLNPSTGWNRPFSAMTNVEIAYFVGQNGQNDHQWLHLPSFDQLPSPVKQILTKSPFEARHSSPCTPLEVRMVSEVPLDVDFGSTHVNQKGDLASDSEDGSPLRSPAPVDIFLSPEKRKLASNKMPYLRRWNASPTPGPQKRSEDNGGPPIRYGASTAASVSATSTWTAASRAQTTSKVAEAELRTRENASGISAASTWTAASSVQTSGPTEPELRERENASRFGDPVGD